MWTGPVTEELKELYLAYKDKFDGEWPDGYDDVHYEGMTYDEFVGYIKKSLETGLPLEEVV